MAADAYLQRIRNRAWAESIGRREVAPVEQVAPGARVWCWAGWRRVERSVCSLPQFATRARARLLPDGPWAPEGAMAHLDLAGGIKLCLRPGEKLWLWREDRHAETQEA